MTDISIAIVAILIIIGAYFIFEAHRYGNGNILLGIKRYFNLSYELPENENTRIADALEDLIARVKAEEGKTFQIIISVDTYSVPHRRVFVKSPRFTKCDPPTDDGTAITWSEDDDRSVFDAFLEDYPRKN